MSNPTLIFRDVAKSAELQEASQAVLSHFNLPDVSLICIFDDAERSEFLEDVGPEYCGFFDVIQRHGIPRWPYELRPHVFSDGFLSEAAVYVRRRTCQNAIGASITFAHELQHVMQYGYSFRAWQACSLAIPILHKKIGAFPPWNIPHEHETQLVSKRVR